MWPSTSPNDAVTSPLSLDDLGDQGPSSIGISSNEVTRVVPGVFVFSGLPVVQELLVVRDEPFSELRHAPNDAM